MKKIGRYEIVEELGRGAMGVVYKATDPTIGRVVAVKALPISSAAKPGVPDAREIFMREARAAGSLSHPGIVAIHDALEDPESQSCCIVMEYVPGRTLQQVLLNETRLETSQALEIARQVADALAYAHAQNVIHRDLKPANILLTDDGRAKLTDFGIAKFLAAEGALRTVATMGTPSYMSPEQVSGGEVDARSDLFSLGVILYLMLTGKKPFLGDTASVMFKIAYEDPVRPSQVNPRLNAGHDLVVLRCLSKSPDKRYASAREFSDDLGDLSQGRPPRSKSHVSISELGVGEPTVKTRPIVPLPALASMPTTRGKRLWVVAVIGGGLVNVALLLGWRLFRQPEAPPSAAQVAPPPSAGTPVPHVAPSKAPPSSIAAPHAKSTAAGKAAATPGGPGLGKETVRTKPEKSQTSPRQLPTVVTVSPRVNAASPKPAAPSNTARVVQITCRHDLENATLVVSSGSQVLQQWPLKGKKKKKGLLGIKGIYQGTLSRSLTLPPGTSDLSVRVISANGSFDLSKQVSLPPPSASPTTLRVIVNGDRLAVDWQAATPSDN